MLLKKHTKKSKDNIYKRIAFLICLRGDCNENRCAFFFLYQFQFIHKNPYAFLFAKKNKSNVIKCQTHISIRMTKGTISVGNRPLIRFGFSRNLLTLSKCSFVLFFFLSLFSRCIFLDRNENSRRLLQISQFQTYCVKGIEINNNIRQMRI